MGAQGIGVGFLGLGAYLPDQIRTNDWWPEEWREEHERRLSHDLAGQVDKAVELRPQDVDPEVIKHAGPLREDVFRGTKQRRVIDPGMMPSDLEIRAAIDALKNSGVPKDEIDCVMGQSLISDRCNVNNHGLVAHGAGLRNHLSAFTVAAGCSSFMPQLQVAASLIKAGQYQKILAYVGCAVSEVTDYDLPTSVLGGDGAVAAVLGEVDEGYGFIAQEGYTHGEYHDAILGVARSTPHTPYWRCDLLEDRITIQSVDPVGTHIAGAHAASLCRRASHRVLERAGYTPDDVDFFIVAQSTAWFGSALADAVGIRPGRWLAPEDHFERYGHLLSASVALNLYLAEQQGRLKRGDLVLIYSPGVGFTTYATLYRWT